MHVNPAKAPARSKQTAGVMCFMFTSLFQSHIMGRLEKKINIYVDYEMCL
jgi:hypothetical protein